MSLALHNSQKRILSQLARRAFNRARALARGRGEVDPAGQFTDANLRREDDFRHHEVALATGKLGLRCCSQDDYGAVRAHFLHLLGQDGEAVKADVHGQNNPRRIVEWKITDALARLGRKINYADSISRHMFHGLPLTDCTDAQLWKIFFALNKQAQRQHHQQQEAA